MLNLNVIIVLYYLAGAYKSEREFMWNIILERLLK